MSFNTGLSGLKAASQNLDVIGHNIANANTTGMKASRAEFAELYAVSIGATGGTGGGIGVEVANVAQLFSQGNVSVTGNDLDIAINGAGFFRVELLGGDIAYTRSGEFKLDKEGYIVTNQGARLTGYTQVDPVTGLIIRGSTNSLSPIQLPTATGIPARQATLIQAGLNLDARADIATVTTAGVPPAASTYEPALETYGTSMVVYDTQGVEVPVRLNFVKTALNTWKVFATPGEGGTTEEIADVTFNPNGTINTITPYGGVAGDPLSINVPTNATAPASTFPVSVDLSTMTQYGTRFSIFTLEQDGYPPGELTGVSISEDGSVMARYSNGESVLSAQIALTNFRNLQGLQPQGSGYWLQTVASGDPITSAPRDPGFGTVRQGALEESNVDITAELVNMITAQRAYQANAQTIKTQDQVLSTLVNLR